MKRSKLSEEQIAYRLRQVEDENRRLKQLMAALTLTPHAFHGEWNYMIRPASRASRSVSYCFTSPN